MKQGQHRSKKDSRRDEYYHSREYKDIHNTKLLAADNNSIILSLKKLYKYFNKILKEDKIMMFNIILCIFLGFFQHMEGTEHVIPLIDDILMHHQVEKNNEVTKNNTAMIVESYKKIVADHVSTQTLSWNRHLSLERDNRPPSERKQQMSIINNTYPELTKIKQIIESSSIGFNTKTTMFHRYVGNNDDESNNIIIWDDEKDISLYFDTLINNCGRHASEASFNKKCWGFLNNLIEKPRCTVRLDSRFQCRQRSWSQYGVKTTAKMTLSVEDLIKEHFLHDTINIVIIGAGPVGLALANALTTVVLETRTQRDSDNNSDDNDIRILVFENRYDNPGLKRPYDRDWVTDLNPENFRVLGDSRLNDFFDLTWDKQSSDVDDDVLNQNEDYQYYDDDNTNSDRIHLPIKAIETLLLLSNRDRGVKFIYDDFQTYETMLASSFDNIIFFDATGHRLHRDDVSVKEQRQQQPNVMTTTSIVSIELSFNETASDTVTSDDYDILVETNNTIQLTGKCNTAATDDKYNDGFYDDTVLYPVYPSDGTTPYDIHFLKISDIRDMDDAAWDTLNWMAGEASKSGTDSACDTVCINRDGHKLCLGEQWCQLYFVWEYTGQYRTDIAERMFKDHPGFSQTVLFLNLSPQQADAFSFILSHNATTKNSLSRVRLSHLPIHEMTKIPTFQENGLDLILQHLTQFSKPQSAIVDLFTYRPYMYPDPILRGGMYGDRQRQQVQPLLLRIGDSLFSGDPNISTGLDNHLWIIKGLVEELKVRRRR